MTANYSASIVALQIEVSINPGTPSWFRRTYALGLLLGFFVAAIVGLFDYNCQAWVYSKSKGFRPFILSKRGPLIQTFESSAGVKIGATPDAPNSTEEEKT